MKTLTMKFISILLVCCMALTVFSACTVGEKSNDGDMEDFAFVKTDAGWEISKYRGNNVSLVIPDTYQGESVIGIGKYAFSNRTELESVTVPASITYIGCLAFYNCTNLKNITFADSSELVNIADEAFWNCFNLESIAIPSSVQRIGYEAFKDCANLKSVTFNNDSMLECINDYAFYGCASMETIVMPNSVTSIGDSVFANCSSLVNVALSSNIASIGVYSFGNCTSLKYNEYDNAFYLGNENNPYLLLMKAKTTEIDSCTIHSNTRFVDSDAFKECINIKSIQIPDGVVGIATRAFWGCTNLEDVVIPNSVVAVGKDVFNHCTNLKYNEYENVLYLGNDDNPYLLLISAKTKKYTKEYTIHTDTRIIQAYAFSGCVSLTKITIPDSVTSIGKGAFDGCQSLTSAELSDNLTGISPYMFYGCTELANVIIPDKVESIGEYAFSGCSRLVDITVPSAVENIGKYAFYGCADLKSIRFTNTLNWHISYRSERNSTMEIDVAEASVNATNLKNTYSGYSWYRE